MGFKFWWVKWTVWEFYPIWLANIPVFGIFVWFAMRARNLLFFTNVNPAIPLSGALGESKSAILDLIPKSLLPNTLVVEPGISAAALAQQLDQKGLHFPIIAKPDIGERGFLVQKTMHFDALMQHLQRFPVRFILQEMLQEPIELAVLFHRFPAIAHEKPRFDITSVCIKSFLSVTGDGVQTVRSLMEMDARSAFQILRFEKEHPALLQQVPEKGAVLLLEPIGNHVLGTRFINGNHLIDGALIRAFEPVCNQIPGVLYGRFDLKCASYEALKRGEFKVMELNGVFGEPAHVYDPNFGMLRAYRDFYRHWLILFQLHRAQLRLGVRPTGFWNSLRLFRAYFRYKEMVKGYKTA
ncbi:MAG: hypothetical protein NW218_02780 [Saprospiraceae bacterium]|nr:hypothetical protein [Saprospiraceae bacterium]